MVDWRRRRFVCVARMTTPLSMPSLSYTSIDSPLRDSMEEGSSWRSAKVPGAVGVGFSIFFALLRARLKDEGLGR